MTGGLLLVVIMLFPLSEIALALARRSRGGPGAGEDRGSLRLLWIGIAVGVLLANIALYLRVGVFPWSPGTSAVAGLCLMLAGLALRWASILVLGRLFTVDVAIQSGHEVVQRGPYRFVRHPSYTGLFLAFLGLGVFFHNWLSLLVLLLPLSLALAYRVVREEAALHTSLGPEYAAYCARTRRFIPWLL